MKRFAICILALVTTLVLAHSAQAQPGGLKLSDVEINGKRAGTVQARTDGSVDVAILKSGHKVTLDMRGGQAVSSKVVDGRGNALTSEVHNTTAARRAIIVIIRTGDGTVIVIVIRSRS